MSKEIPPYTESEYPGFYLIEGFSRYAAHEDGRILDLKRVIVIPMYKDDRGYNYVSVVNDEKERVLYQHYRLMMIAMSDRPDNYKSLVVNHIDNIHGNDELENLEWTTQQGNIEHAIGIGALGKGGGFLSPRRPIDILLVKENKQISFPTISSAAEYLGINARRLKKILLLEQPFFRGEYLIKETADKRPWRPVEIGEKIYNETGNIILVRNYITKEVTEWPSYRQYAKFLGVTADTISWRFKNNNQRLFPEMCQYKFKGDPTPWREPTEEEIFDLKNEGNAKGILIKDYLTGKVSRYRSQFDLSKALGVSTATITTWLAKGDMIQAGRYIVQRETANPVWRKIDNLQETIIRESKVCRYVELTLENGEKKIYPSAKQAADAMGLLPTTLNNRLKSNGQKVFSDGTRWKYL